ncbi:hypothetical protein [Hydrogenophaga sp.]|uniref:hypothetical protein n=1 Tax=Hydrogenophaga sp. TaxID=1904254 RepID=UPI00262A616A|nr:hypothetical protein [Hydrogenophaga sp.]MDM7950751.1 hypothetical protein [Hydrogenophaga sp.]
MRRAPAPASLTIKSPANPGRWVLYFIFLPDGQLTPAHRFSLERLAQEDLQLMLVCACPPGHPVLDELLPQCDSLVWKESSGWDFCGYAIGLAELAEHASGSDVLVMNDSVYGPFSPVAPFIDQAPWRLTGFTGNNQNENHIQSYAFIIKCIDGAFIKHLSSILTKTFRYRMQESVVLCQENPMARKVAEKYTVGSYWFTTSIEANDLCLGWPKQLLEAGFPFMKRSLVGKFANAFNSAAEMGNLLRSLGHPVDI